MEIKIRRAVRSDCARLLELVRELAEFERAPDQVTVTLEHFEESGFGDKPVWWAFVAEIPNSTADNRSQIAGFALYYIRYSTWKGRRMYLEDLVVTEAARGKRLGTLLVDRLIEEAREKKLKGITWQVLEWNEAAINFYKKYNATFDGEWVNCSIDVRE